MKHIRILHLYSNALDLYGDYKNLTVLQRRIAETGNTSDITEINLDEVIDPTGYDFVYIGHGKARNLAAVAPHFAQYGEAIRAAIEGGQVWVCYRQCQRTVWSKIYHSYGGDDAGYWSL